MNSLLTAVINGMLVSAPIAALIWAGLRLTPSGILSAAARYAVWWMALAITIVLPLAYWPAHPSASTARFAPMEIPATSLPSPETEPRQSPLQSSSGLSTPRRLSHFPLTIPAGPWTLWVSAAWAFTSTLFLFRLTLSCAQLARRKTRARIVPYILNRSARRNIRVAVSEEIHAPMAAGFRHPTILIPANLLTQLSSSEIDLIALHEAAHLDRRDDYALIVERILQALFSLHPIVRWIARQIDLEREIACDDRVVEATGQPHPYAACLTRVAELTAGTGPSFAAAAAAEEGSHLTRRVEMLLDKTRRTGTRWFKARLACALAVVFVLAGMAIRTPTLLAFTTPPTAQPAGSIQVLDVPAPPRPPLSLLAQAPRVPPPTVNPAPEPASTTPVVLIPVQVLDAQGRFLTDLQKSDFRVLEDDVEQNVSSFALQGGQVSLGVVVDSQDGVTLPLQEALVELQKRLQGKIEFMIAADGLTKVTSALTDAMNRINQASGATKEILFFTDNSKAYGSSVSDRIIYILPLGDLSRINQVPVIGESSYVLGFISKNRTADGKYRKLRVFVDRPGLLVHSRSGYYPPLR